MFSYCITFLLELKCQIRITLFFLEDDDGNGLFIAQTPRVVMDNGDKSEEKFVCDDYFDLDSKAIMTKSVTNGDCGNIIDQNYLDISDPEDNFMNPIYGRTVR